MRVVKMLGKLLQLVSILMGVNVIVKCNGNIARASADDAMMVIIISFIALGIYLEGR